MKRRLIMLVAIVCAFAMLAPEAALANKSVSTSLSMSVDNAKIRKGHYVTFKGKLSSNRKKCYANRSVSLYKNGNYMSKKRTDPTGRVRFSRRVFQTSKWKIRFLGFTFGTHPKRVTCLGSTSNIIRVRIRT